MLVGGVDNKQVNTQTRSFQTMLCGVEKLKQGDGCRVIRGSGAPVDKATGFSRKASRNRDTYA